MQMHMVMKARVLSAVVLLAGLLAGCKVKSVSDESDGGGGVRENIDANERAIAAKLKPVKDVVAEATWNAKLKTRQAYNSRRFDELEAEAARLRSSKETNENGNWKLIHFYDALSCREDEPESMWQLHDKIHQEWIAAKPTSITARIAYLDFLTDYAWHARGHEYADKVTKEGWRLFGERLAAAEKVFEQALDLDEKDPCLWLSAMSIALGQSWKPAEFDALLQQGRDFAPTFWRYETSRAHSLLPRWHGKPGDWEAFAAQSAARPEGLGVEIYARIVLSMGGYYENVFRETKASWPKTKEGLQAMMQKYPDSLGILSDAALLATMAQDQPMAKELFAKIGDRYLPGTFGKPERFAHYRHWAETGQW